MEMKDIRKINSVAAEIHVCQILVAEALSTMRNPDLIQKTQFVIDKLSETLTSLNSARKSIEYVRSRG